MTDEPWQLPKHEVRFDGLVVSKSVQCNVYDCKRNRNGFCADPLEIKIDQGICIYALKVNK